MNFKHLFKPYSGKHLEELNGPESSATSKQMDSNVKADRSEAADATEEMSRTEYLKQEQVQSETQKRKKLARKLNWVIFYLALAIIVVYCFMLFVNF